MPVKSYKMWVIADRSPRHTAPSIDSGVVGNLYPGQLVNIFEEKGEWVRISPYYDASCENGRSEYIDYGNKECSEQNGIIDGKLAEWVELHTLSDIRPEPPISDGDEIDQLLSESDDFEFYKNVFNNVTRMLIDRGECTLDDLKNYGVWTKSTNKGGAIYFIYCGGNHISNRKYLDAESGELL